MASFCPPRLPSPSPLKRVRAERVGGRRELGRGIKRATGFSWSISAPGCKVPPRKITPRQLSRHRRRYRHPRPPSLLLLEQENRSALVTSRFYLGNERCVVSSRSILILRRENIVESFLILISLSLFSRI